MSDPSRDERDVWRQQEPGDPVGQQQGYGQPQQGYGQPGGQPYGYGQPGGYYQAPPAPGTNGLGIASLILGILWIYWIGSILAVVFGHIALRQIKATGQRGHGLAVAGLVLGYVGVGFLVLFLILVAVGASTGAGG